MLSLVASTAALLLRSHPFPRLGLAAGEEAPVAPRQLSYWMWVRTLLRSQIVTFHLNRPVPGLSVFGPVPSPNRQSQTSGLVPKSTMNLSRTPDRPASGFNFDVSPVAIQPSPKAARHRSRGQMMVNKAAQIGGPTAQATPERVRLFPQRPIADNLVSGLKRSSGADEGNDYDSAMRKGRVPVRSSDPPLHLGRSAGQRSAVRACCPRPASAGCPAHAIILCGIARFVRSQLQHYQVSRTHPAPRRT